MLRLLSIQNIVLIDRLDLEFESGLGVLTGETGAGKSILLDALGMALGARADAGLVRSGAESASVTAELELSSDHPVQGLLGEQGIETDAGEPLIVRRTLKSDGGSRAFLGGTSVPAGLLRDVGGLAVEIHGQHDDRGLLNPRAIARCSTLSAGSMRAKSRQPGAKWFGSKPSCWMRARS